MSILGRKLQSGNGGIETENSVSVLGREQQSCSGDGNENSAGVLGGKQKQSRGGGIV